MRILFKKTEGSVLSVVMVVTGAIAMFIGSHLLIVAHENKLTKRSLAWNTAIPVAEAGIEEALTQLKSNYTNLVANNDWELVNGNYFMKEEKWLNTNEYYRVGIFNTVPPVIVSEGFSRPNFQTKFISRTVRVDTELQQYFSKGMVADVSVKLNGNDITIDSFDSTDSQYSTGGKYDITKRKDNGSVALNSTLDNSFNLGNANIWGKISVAPGGQVSTTNKLNMVVGDSDWHDGGNSGIQPGAFTDDVNITMIEVEAPFSSAIPPPKDASGAFVMGTGDYCVSGANQFTGNVIVTGTARLLVTDSFKNNNSITIQPGGSLELYMAGASAELSGPGVINYTGVAANFRYFGLPSNKILKVTGNGEFIGAIYAPSADFTLGGGGSSIGDFAGACVTRTVTMNGKYNFHFDESLATSTSSSGYIAIYWDELNTTWDEILTNNLTVADLQ
jgi:hypothetical protein